MAEMNDFEDIKAGFRYITDVLDSIRAQNVINVGNTDKILTSINSKLEQVANEENTDLIKVFLAELKKSLDERYNFVSSKFGELESSFNTLVKKSENQLEGNELREVFEIIATNLSVFSKDFSAQKDIISAIDVKIEEIKQDDSQKKDILRNISVVKMEIEKFSNGFESIILNLNGKFKELSEILIKLDSSEELSAIKKDIENIFMSTNAVLSTMQVIDRKNRDLEEIITHVVTKEDFNAEREQVAKLIAQNVQLADFVDGLPTKNNVDALSSKVDDTVNIINALKNMLAQTNEQSQKMLTVQLDNLESKILNISTEEEFIGFRKELQEFAKEIVNATNLMRGDLEKTNTDLKALSDFLDSMDIKETFETFATQTKDSETIIKQEISNSTNAVVKEISKNKNLVKDDIDNSTESLTTKIESTKQEIFEDSKSNLASVIEHVQGIINNIFSVKNAIHIENEENLEKIDEKIEGLKEEVITSGNFVAQASHKSSEEVKASLSVLCDNLASLQEDLIKTAEVNTSEIRSSIDEIKTLQENFDEKNHSDLEKMTSLFSSVSAQLNEQKQFLSESSQANFESMSLKIQALISSLQNAAENMNDKLSANFSEITESISTLPQLIKDNQSVFEEEKRLLLEENSKNILEVGDKIQDLVKNFVNKDNPFKSEVLFEFSNMKKILEALKYDIDLTNADLDEKIKTQLEENIQKIDESLSEYSEKYISSILSLQNSLSGKIEIAREISQESSLKIENSIREAQEIKGEIYSLSRDLEEIKNDSSVAELTQELEKRFEDVSEIISNLENSFENKNKSSLAKSLEFLNEKFVEINNILETRKEHSEIQTGTILDDFSDKVEALKTQMNLVGTDILNSMNFKNQEIISLISPIKETLEEFTAQDLGEMFSDVKRDVDSSVHSVIDTLEKNIKQTSQEKFVAISEKILLLEDKLEDVNIKLSEDDSYKFEELKVLIYEINQSEVQNLDEVSEKVDAIVNQLAEFNIHVDGVKSVVKNTENVLSSKIENVQFAVLEAQDQLKSELLQTFEHSHILDEIKVEQEESKAEIISAVQNAKDAAVINLRNSLNNVAEEKEQSLIEKFRQLQDETGKIILEKLNLMNISDELDEFKTSLAEQIQGETSKMLEASDILVNAQNDLKQELHEDISIKLDETKKTVIDQIIDSNIDNKIEIMNNFSQVSRDSESKIIDEILNSFDSSKEDILERLSEVSVIKENILDGQDSLKSELIDCFEETSSEIESKVISEVVENSIALKNELLDAISKNGISQEDFSQSQEAIKSDIKENIAQSALESESKIFAEMDSVKDEIKEDIKTEIIEQIVKSKEETEEAILEELSENLNVIKEVIVSIAPDDSKTQQMISKIEDIFSSIKSVSSQIEGRIAESSTKFETSTQSALSTLKTNFYEKVDDTFDDFKSFVEILQDKNEVQQNLDKVKEDLTEKLDSVQEQLVESFSKISVKEDMEALNDSMISQISSILDSAQEKMLSLLDSNQEKNESKSDEVSKRVEDLKRIITEEISEKIDKFELNSDTQSKDFSELVESLKLSISELRENFVDLSLNTGMEISNSLVIVQEKISDIEEKLNTLNFNNDFENIINKIDSIDFISPVEDSKNAIMQDLELINQKLDALSETDDEALIENVEEVKEMLTSQKELLKKLDNFATNENINNIKEDINAKFIAFDSKLAVLLKLSKEAFDKNKEEKEEKPDESVLEEIKVEIDSFKESMFESLIEMFNQISFVEETEDLKDFIEEKTDEIKAELSSSLLNSDLKSSLDKNFENIMKSLKDLHQKAGGQEPLSSVENWQDDGYSYTLQDVETDIAKLRLTLKDLSERKTDVDLSKLQDLEKLNDDIVSISTRTNKLLLNSDESYSVLKDNLNNFREIIYQIEERIKYIDNSEKISSMEEKIENINNLTLSCVKSDKVFNQTFMYLAEWIDKTDERMAKIETQLEEVKDIKQGLNMMQKNMIKTSDLENLFDKFSKKFDRQQEKIKSLETKIAGLGKKETSKDLKTVVQEALSKLSVPEAKIDSKLVKKVEGIDKQLATLGKNIEKITSYVD